MLRYSTEAADCSLRTILIAVLALSVDRRGHDSLIEHRQFLRMVSAWLFMSLLSEAVCWGKGLSLPRGPESGGPQAVLMAFWESFPGSGA